MSQKRYMRSTTDRKIAGVCGGLAAYFGIDPLLVRILAVATILFGGAGILVYILLWVLAPEDGGVARGL